MRGYYRDELGDEVYRREKLMRALFVFHDKELHGFAYRFIDRSYSVGDEYGDHAYSRTEIELEVYGILRRTKCGVQLVGGRFGVGHPRFVNLSAHKQFACLTVEGALASYRARKLKQCSIYEARARKARYCHDTALRLSENYTATQPKTGEPNVA